MATATTTKRRNDLIEMFLDATPGESYADGRLSTIETENGVALVAYGNEILAEISADATEVTLYIGHYRSVSKTVTRYIHFVGKLLSQREMRDVTVLEGHAPTTGYGRASRSAQYISNYVRDYADMSGAEEKAYNDVREALRNFFSQLD